MWMYRTTPHDALKVSPFEVMRGRGARTKCNPEWMLKAATSTVAIDVIRSRIVEKHKYKEMYDLIRNSKDICIKVGCWVKIKKPWKVRKGESQLSEPLRVIKVLRNAVQLSDGKVWNLKHVAIYRRRPNSIQKNFFC